MPEDIFALGGGIDQSTDYLRVAPGLCRFAKNFEPKVTGGYERGLGYECFDGRPSPHAQTYKAFIVTDASVYSVGDTATGVTSGASGTVIGVDTTSNWIGVSYITGTFSEGESLTVATLVNILGDTLGPDALSDDWDLAAQNLYRNDISQVPGSGPVRGVHKLNNVVYAFRDNVGGTECAVHSSSASGWVAVTLPSILFFNTGAGAEPSIGDTVSGGATGATATILNYVKNDGSWLSDAAGYLILTNIVAGVLTDDFGFIDSEQLSFGAGLAALAVGDSYQYSLLPGGDYDIISCNFYATPDGYMMYGADGVNPAFEYDGTAFTPVFLPNDPGAPAENTPTLVACHHGHLFLMYGNGLVQHSVQGEPTVFIGFLGAGEFGVGSAGTALVSEVGGPLLIRTRRETFALFGHNSLDWELRKVSGYGGSIIHTSELMSEVVSYDDKGIVLQSRTEKFGNFDSSTVSRSIQPIIDATTPFVTRSVVIRGKNQYRVFASDNTFIVMHPRENGAMEFMTGEYLTDVTCITNTNDNTPTEEIYFGSSDGYVYQAEVGRNYDGEAIESFIKLPFVHGDKPNHRKRYRRAWLDLDATSLVDLRISAELDYGKPTALEPLLYTQGISGGVGGTWDVDNWDQVFWDLQSLHFVRYDMTGSGANFALTFYNNSATTDPFTLQAVRVDYEVRRKER